jgi:hypothetical protein
MLQRILATLLGLALVVVAFLITSVLIAVIVTAGLLAWAWLWWRGPRRAPEVVVGSGGRVVEGEYRIIDSK